MIFFETSNIKYKFLTYRSFCMPRCLPNASNHYLCDDLKTFLSAKQNVPDIIDAEDALLTLPFKLNV